MGYRRCSVPVNPRSPHRRGDGRSGPRRFRGRPRAGSGHTRGAERAGAEEARCEAGAAPRRPARRVEYWIGAVPTTWNVVPSGTDPMPGTTFDPAKTTMQTAIYRRFTRRLEEPAPAGGLRPRRARSSRPQVGDTIVVHFKNFDPNNPHSMHFHGVHYDVASDGAYIPGVSGPRRRREAGRRRSRTSSSAAADSAGVWPYHDHSPSMDASIRGGLYGALSIRAQGAEEARPRVRRLLREAAQLQHGRRPRVHQQHADVPREGRRASCSGTCSALGDDHHSFHVHGHRWTTAGRPARRADGQPGRVVRLPLEGGQGPARGSTTATSRST